MSKNTLIKNVSVVNENNISVTSIFIKNGKITKIGDVEGLSADLIIDGKGKFLLPGIIDAQVHFRDPGLTHKADLNSETRAAVAGGVTSFMDMPNTQPNVLTIELLEEKYKIAAEKSLANYGFFMGINMDNLADVMQMDTSRFFALSDDGLYFTKRGNLLADHTEFLDELFEKANCIIALHAEKEKKVIANEDKYKEEYGEKIPFHLHPEIRDEDVCFEATKDLVELAKKNGTRLHILHLTTAKEAELFRNDIPLKEKKITTEVCVQHLWFNSDDYAHLGAKIKWNPAIKSKENQDGLLQALLDDHIDLVTTDHAPHTKEEKSGNYFHAKSGAPMIQHSLNVMLEFYKQGKISLEKIVEKMCHNPAVLYDIENRGFIREGYAADLTLVDLDKKWKVTPDNTLYKCGWSPMEGTEFSTQVTHTFVNGNLVYQNGKINEEYRGERLTKKEK